MNKKLIAASAVAGLALTLGTTNVASAHHHGGYSGDKVTSVLSGLVTKGTITQSQADAITKAMTDARDNSRAQHKIERAERTKVITDALGIDEATLKSKLQAGESLAKIAGVKKDSLIAALVAFETKKIDAAVTAGKLSTERAATLKASLRDRITAMVEATPAMGNGHRMGMGHHGEFGFEGSGPKGKGHGRGGR